MADLTDNLVQEYEVIPANQDVGNRFDQDNFYPMDGEYEDVDDFYDEEYEDFDDEEDALLSFEEDEEIYDSFDDNDSLEDYEFFDNDDEFSEARGRRKNRQAKRQARKSKLKAKRQARKSKRQAIKELPKEERKSARGSWMKNRQAKRQERIAKRKAMSPEQRKELRKKRLQKFGRGAKKVARYYPPIALFNLGKKAYRKHKSKKEMENNSNFYGDEDYSELFGIKSKKKGGEGIWKGITNLVKTKDTQEGVSRLDERLKKRGEKAKYRADRRTLRRDARQARKLLKLPPEEQQKVKTIAGSSGIVKNAVIEVSKGLAVPEMEQIADQTIAVAQKLSEPATKLDTDAVKTALNEAQDSVQETNQALDEILDDNNPKGQKGWAGMSNGAKAGIIGGGVVVLGLIAFGIYKISNR